MIVDYKTGRHAPTPADAAASPALALYALATARTLRRPCRRVELHHLPTGVVAAWRHDEASLAEHLDRAERSADRAGRRGRRLGGRRRPGGAVPGPARCRAAPAARCAAAARRAGRWDRRRTPWAMLVP